MVVAAHAGLSLDDELASQSRDHPTPHVCAVAAYGRRPSAGRVNSLLVKATLLMAATCCRCHARGRGIKYHHIGQYNMYRVLPRDGPLSPL